MTYWKIDLLLPVVGCDFFLHYLSDDILENSVDVLSSLRRTLDERAMVAINGIDDRLVSADQWVLYQVILVVITHDHPWSSLSPRLLESLYPVF